MLQQKDLKVAIEGLPVREMTMKVYHMQSGASAMMLKYDYSLWDASIRARRSVSFSPL